MKKKDIKKILWIALPILIVFGAAFLIVGISSANAKKFASTGERINNLIKEINILASASNERFQLIDEKQKNYDFKNALELIIEEKNNNEKINEAAMSLTEQLKELTKLSSSFSDVEKRQKIEEAIKYQIEAVGHLINYGSGIDIILAELAQKYESQLGGSYYEIKRDLHQTINLIKKEMQSADEYSRKFTQALNEIN